MGGEVTSHFIINLWGLERYLNSSIKLANLRKVSVRKFLFAVGVPCLFEFLIYRSLFKILLLFTLSRLILPTVCGSLKRWGFGLCL